eukprot:TRINITY_DN41632_c0_g1_i1.p1 TRINITY_DN41632_c0_g1~~TRINITY_DN41632_c0_g1_i1.p1  ORF type:complete len:120 (-),score=4.99 TRINITY_DN41632_c0_g1_i1:116-445(-)
MSDTWAQGQAHNWDGQGEAWVGFMRPGCPHCERAHPTWVEFENKGKAGKKLAEVNCGTNHDLCSQMGIMGVPTFLHIGADGKPASNAAGQRDEFHGERTVAGFESWVGN